MREWHEQELFFDGDAFFSSIEDAIASARRTIDFETYIFENDACGRDMARCLVGAARRGVRVRLIVDGVGSWGFSRYLGPLLEEGGVAFKIYHKLPWEEVTPFNLIWKRARFFELLGKINNRNHRKICVIDRKVAWVSSMNVVGVHRCRYSGSAAWRDTGIKVRGDGVVVLLRAFHWAWSPWPRKLLKLVRRRKALAKFAHPYLRLNMFSRFRQRNYRELLRNIKQSKRRIWIANSYFVPDGSLIRALEQAAGRGVDVRIIVPRKIDVLILNWVTSAFYEGLTKAGVRIFEYLPVMFHAKTIIIDDVGMLGSSNLNHRSLFHDLEADVILSSRDAFEKLAASFLADLEHSIEIKPGEWRGRSWWTRILGRIALYFRYWL